MSTTPRTIDLPPEILQHISRYLSQPDRTVSARVCKTWNQWITPTLWHTVDLTEANQGSAAAFFRFKHLFGDLAAQGNSNNNATSGILTFREAAAKRARQGFLRNLSFIRVLRIQYADHWFLFFDPNTGSRQAYKLNLQELSAELKGLKFLNTVNYLVLLLSHSSQLRKLSLQMENLHPAHRERLFAALPKSLETLTLVFQQDDIYDEELSVEDTEARLYSMAKLSTTGDLQHLKVLSITGLHTDTDTFLALFKRCPALEDLNLIGHGRFRRKAANPLKNASSPSLAVPPRFRSSG